MHPQQHELTQEIEGVWLAALAHAEVEPNTALLYTLAGANGDEFGAKYLYRGMRIHAEAEPAAIHPLLNDMNSEACIDAYRVVVFTDRTIEGIAALIRHELEHAKQREAHGQRLMGLYSLACDVIAERVGGLTGGAFLYQVIPVEMDANAAAAAFVRGAFTQRRIDQLLAAGDSDGSAFRSLVGAPDIDTLPERMVRFFATIPDLCELYGDRAGFSFAALLDVHWRGAGRIWRCLFEEENLRLPRR